MDTGLLPLKRKINRGITLIFGLFGLFGLALILAVFFATRISPQMIHRNYDSIEAAQRMQTSWSALRNPEEYPERSQQEWIDAFDSALRFASGNVTEPGESEVISRIKEKWTRSRRDAEVGRRMQSDLALLIELNKQGLFRLAAEAQAFGTRVLLGSLFFFAILILFTSFISGTMARNLASPLQRIAAALAARPRPGESLDLPDPTSQELHSLCTELNALWSRVSETDRLNLEQILAQRNKLRTILASVEDAILVLDAEGTIAHCNAKLLKLIGLENRDIQGSPWKDIPSSHPNLQALNEYLRSEAPLRILEFRLDGKPVTLQGRRRVIQGEGQIRELGTVHLFHDVTDQRQRERLKAEFIGVLSHELKTPLQSLSTASDLLVSRINQLSDDMRLLVETVSEDVSRIRAVANDFVQVSQLDQPSLRLRLDQRDLSRAMQDWIKPFQVLARDKGIRLRYVKEGSDRIPAKVDPVKFPWVISNLLSNALRVSPNDSTVTVLLTDRNGAIELKISDEGPGIPESVRQRMYEPFFQGDPEAGTSGLLGIGLTIVREVVEAHDGRVEHHSLSPRGSVFRVLLPFTVPVTKEEKHGAPCPVGG